MAGYIFSISKDGWESFIENDLRYGVFSPYCLEIPMDATDRQKKSINKVLAATFGDMVTMKPGDNIYFLSNRKIYGVGTAKKIGEDCKYDNYIGASALIPDYDIDHNSTEFLIVRTTRARWFCIFEPKEHLFKKGVDMDDVLQFRPSAFKMLRAFEGLSFIKIDDEENRALKEYICLKNEAIYDNIEENTFAFDDSKHNELSKIDLSSYKMDILRTLGYREYFENIDSEMFVETVLLQYLSEGATTPLGNWDYVTHQIIASPFKPLKYIDKIDVFGYRFSKHYNDHPRLITKYLLVEMKKGKINKAALEQTMQYVDWICKEYASGDYSMIEAFVVGDRAVNRIDEIKKEVCQRAFISSSHPATPEKWSNLHIVTYDMSNTIIFNENINETN